MSIRWMTEIWESGPEDPSLCYLLIAIADNANDDGVAWPSMEHMTKKTRLSLSTVRRCLVALEKDGWLQREIGGASRGERSQYQLLKPWLNKGVMVTPKTNGKGVMVTPKKRSKGVMVTPKTKGVMVTPQPEVKGVMVTRLGCHGDAKNGGPLINLLTVNESSGKELLGEKNLSGEKGASETVPGVADHPRQEPTPSCPPRVIPFQPGKTEIQTLADLVLLACPPGRRDELTSGSITPVHRIPVIAAAKREAHEHGMSLPDAFEGIRKLAEAQSEQVPEDRWTFFGKLDAYFNESKYRRKPVHFQERSNGKSKHERIVDNAKRAAAELEAHFSGTHNDVGQTRGKLINGNAQVLHG